MAVIQTCDSGNFPTANRWQSEVFSVIPDLMIGLMRCVEQHYHDFSMSSSVRQLHWYFSCPAEDSLWPALLSRAVQCALSCDIHELECLRPATRMSLVSLCLWFEFHRAPEMRAKYSITHFFSFIHMFKLNWNFECCNYKMNKWINVNSYLRLVSTQFV